MANNDNKVRVGDPIEFGDSKVAEKAAEQAQENSDKETAKLEEQKPAGGPREVVTQDAPPTDTVSNVLEPGQGYIKNGKKVDPNGNKI
jgi:hypothetical protein